MANFIEDKVSKFITEYKLENKSILVGFSGGFDSMCLLNVLKKLQINFGYRLIACHYNHNWRGEEAKKEQENCCEFCRKKGIEFYTGTAPNDIKKNETEARELRYEFFEEALREFSADVVFTAHNWDDNAETILYRIAKGTGIVGLKGILPQRDKYYRPLISVKRKDIEKYCFENNLCPNCDTSNSDTIHKRNLIRHDIIPLLGKINPDIKNALNSLGKIAQSESNIVDEYINQISMKIYDGERIKTSEFIELSDDVKQKIIYNLIYNSEFDYTMETILNICEFVEETVEKNKPSKFSLDKTHWLYVDKNIIEIIEEPEKTSDIVEIRGEGLYNLGDKILKIERIFEYEKTNTEDIVCVDLSGVKNICLRTRRDGDVITPLGSSGHMKLKKYFMEKNIPQHMRDSIALVADKKEILWVAGIGLSDKIKTITVPTHKLTISYNGEKK